MADGKSNDLMVQVEDAFMKLPPLSKSAREAIVGITPWLALIFGVLGVLASLAGLGILSVLSPLAILGGGMHDVGAGLIAVVLALVGSALLLAAYPGTKGHKMAGWKLLFWSQVVELVSAVLNVSVGGVLVSLIAFYLLFQIKSYYK